MKIKASEKEDEEKEEQKAKIQSESSGDRPHHTELQEYFSCERRSDLFSECNKFSSAQSNAKGMKDSPPINFLTFNN